MLDLGAHRIGPRLGTEDADLERTRSRVETLIAKLIEDRQHVARRHRNDVGLEIDDQLDLALGHAAGDRDRGATELLGAVMHPEPAGEQAVAVRVMYLHAAPAAARINAACAD